METKNPRASNAAMITSCRRSQLSEQMPWHSDVVDVHGADGFINGHERSSTPLAPGHGEHQ